MEFYKITLHYSLTYRFLGTFLFETSTPMQGIETKTFKAPTEQQPQRPTHENQKLYPVSGATPMAVYKN